MQFLTVLSSSAPVFGVHRLTSPSFICMIMRNSWDLIRKYLRAHTHMCIPTVSYAIVIVYLQSLYIGDQSWALSIPVIVHERFFISVIAHERFAYRWWLIFYRSLLFSMIAHYSFEHARSLILSEMYFA